MSVMGSTGSAGGSAGAGGGGVPASGRYGSYAGAAANIASQFIGPTGGLNEFQRNRQANIGILNEYEDALQRSKIFDPGRAFKEAQAGNARAGSLTAAGITLDSPFGRGVGIAGGKSAADIDPILADIAASLRDPSTYSIRNDADGTAVFDPQAFNPLNLAFARGRARDGGYIQGDEQGTFIQDGGERESAGRLRGAASGALSGASAGSAAGPYGAAAGAAAGAIIGGIRGTGAPESQANRQANIATINALERDVALQRSLDPRKAYTNALGGLARGNSLGLVGQAPGQNYGDPLGADVGGLQNLSPAELDTINGLKNPDTYGLRKDESGKLIWDPLAQNPLALNFLSGRAENGGFQSSRNSGPQFFGQPPRGGEGRSAPSRSSNQRQRPETDEEEDGEVG